MYSDLLLPQVNHGAWVAILPHIERAAPRDSVNYIQNIYIYFYITVQRAAPGALHCPSDPKAGRRDFTSIGGASFYLDIPPGEFIVTYSSYSLNTGRWTHGFSDAAKRPELTSQSEGIGHTNSSARLSEVRDGTSRTFLIGERAHGSREGRRLLDANWWFDGWMGDTLFWTLFPLNSYKRAWFGKYSAFMHPLDDAAGSFHPGGAHFAFCDGSTRFVKETIDSWEIDESRGWPRGVTGEMHLLFIVAPGTRVGVFQALSTRAGGEAVSADGF